MPDDVFHFVQQVLRRRRAVPRPGLQGEEYEAAQMTRRAQQRRQRFAQNLVKKVGHKNFPFLDDPYD